MHNTATPAPAGLLIANGTVAAPGLSFSSDTSSGWYYLGAADIALALGGIKVWEYAAGASKITYASADAVSYELAGYKARGTVASPTAITSGDDLLRIAAYGYSGAAGYVKGAEILFGSEGTIATTRVPGVIVFRTGTDAAPTVLTEAARITSAQNVYIGLSAVLGGLSIPRLLLASPTGTTDTMLIEGYGANAQGPIFTCVKTRGANATTHSLVSSGDRLLLMDVQGSDGSAPIRAAQIEVTTEGTPAANTMPGRIILRTSTTNTAIEALRINSSQVLILGKGEAGTTAATGNTFRAPDAATGGAGNVAGSTMTIAAGLGTGTGTTGSIIFSLPIVAAAGDIIQTRATRLTLGMGASTTTLTMTLAQALSIAGGTVSVTDTTDATALGTASVVLSGGLSVASAKQAWFGGRVVLNTAAADTATTALLSTSATLTDSTHMHGLNIRPNITQNGTTGLTIDAAFFGTGTYTFPAVAGTPNVVSTARFDAPTLAGGATSGTITDLATLYITGAPALVGALTATNGPYSLFVKAGTTRCGGDLAHTGTNLGFYSHAVAAQPTKVGHNNWAAISDVTAALAAIGLVDAA